MLRVCWRPDARLSFQKWLWKPHCKWRHQNSCCVFHPIKDAAIETDYPGENATTNRKLSLLLGAPEPHSLSCGLYQYNDALCLPYGIPKTSDWHRDLCQFSYRKINTMPNCRSSRSAASAFLLLSKICMAASDWPNLNLFHNPIC